MKKSLGGFLIYIGAASSCFAAPAWYPKGDDQCAEFVTKLTAKSSGELSTPSSDPVMKKLIDDFNSSTGTNDRGGTALIYLFGYCNTHATTRLGDVSANDLVALARQQGLNDQIEQWYKRTLPLCNSKPECVGIVTNYRNHAISCNSGDQNACSDRDRDLQDLNQYNSPSTAASSVPQQAPTDSLQSCLQNTAKSVAQYCASHNQCNGAALATVKAIQETQCGYSAIKLH